MVYARDGENVCDFLIGEDAWRRVSGRSYVRYSGLAYCSGVPVGNQLVIKPKLKLITWDNTTNLSSLAAE